MDTKLYKNSANKIISGVCSGIAESIKIDPTIVRIVAAAICIYWPIFILAYLILAVILPDKATVMYQTKQSENPAESSENNDSSSQKTDQMPPGTPPVSSKSTGIIFAVILICSGVGLFITRVVFNYAIGFSDFLTFVTLGIGIYLIVSGLIEKDDPKPQRKAKIITGFVILLICLFWIFDIFGYNIFSINEFLSSIRYLWPLFIIAVGLNVLMPTRKASAIIWLSLIVLIVIYTVLHGSLSINPFGLVHI